MPCVTGGNGEESSLTMVLWLERTLSHFFLPLFLFPWQTSCLCDKGSSVLQVLKTAQNLSSDLLQRSRPDTTFPATLLSPQTSLAAGMASTEVSLKAKQEDLCLISQYATLTGEQSQRNHHTDWMQEKLYMCLATELQSGQAPFQASYQLSC